MSIDESVQDKPKRELSKTELMHTNTIIDSLAAGVRSGVIGNGNQVEKAIGNLVRIVDAEPRAAPSGRFPLQTANAVVGPNPTFLPPRAK